MVDKLPPTLTHLTTGISGYLNKKISLLSRDVVLSKSGKIMKRHDTIRWRCRKRKKGVNREEV
jgi:hypothetical protein